jgi:predicted membrane-bound mannosyltransferase
MYQALSDCISGYFPNSIILLGILPCVFGIINFKLENKTDTGLSLFNNYCAFHSSIVTALTCAWIDVNIFANACRSFKNNAFCK